SKAFFEKKLSLSPKELNRIHEKSVEKILTEQLVEKLEGKCSEHGFVVSGTVKILSRSMGYYDQSNYTGDTSYFVKAEATVINSVDEFQIVADVIRKNKMGLYANFKDALRIIVPRDLNIGNEEFESVQVGDKIEIMLKKSKFQVNDPYILVSAQFVRRIREGDDARVSGVLESKTYD
ncbi:MAG: hypothetical protein EB120_13680, partial [Proteobacteria bacterium]|nr:hypothetical protein [Pseudomonadota bacterium]